MAHTQRTTDNNALGQVDAIPSQRHQARASSQPWAPIGTQRAPNHSEWVVRIISDKVKGASRPAASQASVAPRACVLLLAGAFPARWLAPHWRAGYRPMWRGRKRPEGSGEARASRATTLTLCALFSRPSTCPLVSVNRADRRSYSEGRDTKIAQFVKVVGGAVLFVQDDATLVISPAEVSANL